MVWNPRDFVYGIHVGFKLDRQIVGSNRFAREGCDSLGSHEWEGEARLIRERQETPPPVLSVTSRCGQNVPLLIMLSVLSVMRDETTSFECQQIWASIPGTNPIRYIIVERFPASATPTHSSFAGKNSAFSCLLSRTNNNRGTSNKSRIIINNNRMRWTDLLSTLGWSPWTVQRNRSVREIKRIADFPKDFSIVTLRSIVFLCRTWVKILIRTQILRSQLQRHLNSSPDLTLITVTQISSG